MAETAAGTSNAKHLVPGEKDSTSSEGTRLGALRHGLAVLDMFDEGGRGSVTATEIALHLGIHKSTASRIASNLALSGYLVQVTHGTGYRLGGKLMRLGAAAAAGTNLTTIATRHVTGLVDELGETCHVGVLEGAEAVTIVCVDGSYALRLRTWVGKRAEAYTTATGKVLLSGLPGSAFDELFPEGRLEHRAPNRTRTAAELKTRLRKIQRDGFALDDEELEPGLRCVAAPIFDHNHEVVAALAVGGASSRMTLDRIDSYVEKVVRRAAEISADLGAPTA